VDTGAPLRALLALCTLLPVFAYASLVTLAVSHRSLRALSALAGLAVSHAVNSLLKGLIQQPRPPPLPHALHPLQTSGMPSNHSQQAAFLATYAALLILCAHPRRSRAPRADRAAGLAAAAAYAVLVAASRVSVRAHTVGQVSAGAALGWASACLWVALEGRLLSRQLVRAGLASPLAVNVLRVQVALSDADGAGGGVRRKGGRSG
jgi:dolichyldiphosphatase